MPVQCKICQMIVENLKKMYFTELIIDYIELMQFCPIFFAIYTHLIILFVQMSSSFGFCWNWKLLKNTFSTAANVNAATKTRWI